MKVYLASRFSRLPELNVCRTSLIDHGIEVTSRWLLGGHEWIGQPDDIIPPAINAQFAQEDLEDIDAADVIVCFTEVPGGGSARGGRHFEAGYAYAHRKPVIVVGHRENVFYCLTDVTYCRTWDEALQILLNAVACTTEPAGVLP